MLKPHLRSVPQTRPVPVTETELEPMYWVVIHNDDVTPMDFVIKILRSIFQVEGISAVQIMYTAHYHGSANVQCLPKAEGQNRINRAHFAAAIEGYPLHFTLELAG